MTAPSPEPAARAPCPPAPLGRWQYSLKFLLIFTTGVCIWAKLATVVYPLCGGPMWFKATFIVWTGRDWRRRRFTSGRGGCLNAMRFSARSFPRADFASASSGEPFPPLYGC